MYWEVALVLMQGGPNDGSPPPRKMRVIRYGLTVITIVSVYVPDDAVLYEFAAIVPVSVRLCAAPVPADTPGTVTE
jgi:hypothetical protein